MPDGGVIVALAVCGVLFALLAKVFVRSGPDNKLFESWAQYGTERGLRFVPPGMMLGERMPMLPDETMRIDLDETRRETGSLFTRIVAKAELPQEARFRCEVRTQRLEELREPLATLDSDFDESYALTAESESSAKIAVQLVGVDLRAALMALRSKRGLRLDYDHGEILLAWRGAEMDHAMLDHARDSVLALVRARPTTAGYR
jgi:hypothetical protein